MAQNKKKILTQAHTELAHELDPAATEFDDQTVAAESEKISVDDLKKRSVIGAFSYFGTTLVLNIVALIANFLLMAFLDPADFGIYGFVIQINAILVFFSDVGLASSLIQKQRQPNEHDYHTVFWTQQALSWLIFLIALIIVATGFVSDKTGAAGNWILVALALSFPLATLKTVSSIKLTREMQFHKLIIPQIFEQIFYNFVLIVLAWRGFGVMAYAYAILARSLIGVAVMMIIKPYKPKWLFDRQSFQGTIKFGLKFQANDFLARIKDNLFYLVVGWQLPAAQFGYISWAKNWSMYPYNLTVQNIMNITFPTFSRLQDRLDLLRKAIEKSIFFITTAIFPILTGMVTFIYPLTVVVSNYAKWQPAISSFVLFTLAIAWSAISSPLTNTLNATGRINQTLKLMIFWTILTWALTFPLMNWLGFAGVAWSAFLISFTSFIPVILVKKFTHFRLWENIWRQLLASLVMAAVALAGQTYWLQNLGWLIVGGVISGSVYLVTLFLFGRRKLLAEIKSLRSK